MIIVKASVRGTDNGKARAAMCVMCISKEVVDHLTITPVTIRRDERGGPAPALSFSLCSSCTTWARDILRVAANGPRIQPGVLGFPTLERQHSPGLACDFCKGVAGIGSALVGMGATHDRRALATPGSQLRNAALYRVCEDCLAWCRAFIDDQSALRGTSHRAAEGGMGGWLATPGRDACAADLDERDEFVLRETSLAMGYAFSPVTSRCETRCPLAEESQLHAAPPLGNATWGRLACRHTPALFVAAGRLGEASAMAASTSPSRLARTVIVARSGTLVDAVHAFRKGCADLLVSPLSPQQVAGAMDRLSDPEGHLGRDPRSGLPIYRFVPRFDLPSFRFAVTPPDGEGVMRTVLLLRRFMRGYDRIGGDGNGGIVVHVYTPKSGLGPIARRLAAVLAPGTHVELLDRPGLAAAA